MPQWTPRPPPAGASATGAPLRARAEREHHSALRRSPHGPFPPARCLAADLARGEARDVAAMLTAAAFGPIGPLSFVAPTSDCGLGLVARARLRPGQFVSEYDGPRLPTRLQVHGQYVLQVPATSVVIDGACENSPYECGARSPAVYANHSRRPNARIESWPVLRPGPCEVRQHMMLVASEHIDAGQEIRVDYEGGGVATVGGSYWDVLGHTPSEGRAWRKVRHHPPPPANEVPVIDRLEALQAAVAARRGGEAPPCHVPAPRAPTPWEGASGGDARLHAIVPLLSANSRDANQSAWPIVSTHVPGRSGRECKERWAIIQDIDENSGWLQASATRAVSHAEAAASMAAAHRAAAAEAAAAATREASSDEECEASQRGVSRPPPLRERCCISGCKRQLLTCFGQKRGGSALGCAEDPHHVCAPCLYHWFASEAALRADEGLRLQSRRTCPVCKSELRTTCSEIRSDADKYVMGLLKIERTW